MEKTERFWDRLSKNYDKPDKVEAVSQYQSIQTIKKYLTGNDIVLDFGCATGTVALALADNVKEIHGMDISSKMIKIAKQRAIDHKSDNMFFTQATIDDYPNRDASFDMILAFSVIHLLENSEVVMQKINKLLKQGGYFISLTPCLGEKRMFRFLSSLGQSIRILPFLQNYRIIDLENSIFTGNFEIVESKSLENNPLEHFIIAQKPGGN